MSRRQKEPLRALSDGEQMTLSRLSRSRRAPAAQGARATALLAIAEGQSYTAAAKQVGRRNGDTVALWVARFNREGLARRSRGGRAAPWGRAAGPLCRRAAAAHSRRGRADPGPSP